MVRTYLYIQAMDVEQGDGSTLLGFRHTVVSVDESKVAAGTLEEATESDWQAAAYRAGQDKLRLVEAEGVFVNDYVVPVVEVEESVSEHFSKQFAEQFAVLATGQEEQS